MLKTTTGFGVECDGCGGAAENDDGHARWYFTAEDARAVANSDQFTHVEDYDICAADNSIDYMSQDWFDTHPDNPANWETASK